MRCNPSSHPCTQVRSRKRDGRLDEKGKENETKGVSYNSVAFWFWKCRLDCVDYMTSRDRRSIHSVVFPTCNFQLKKEPKHRERSVPGPEIVVGTSNPVNA